MLESSSKPLLLKVTERNLQALMHAVRRWAVS